PAASSSQCRSGSNSTAMPFDSLKSISTRPPSSSVRFDSPTPIPTSPNRSETPQHYLQAVSANSGARSNIDDASPGIQKAAQKKDNFPKLPSSHPKPPTPSSKDVNWPRSPS